MACILCKWFAQWVGVDPKRRGATISAAADAWEEEHSNEWQFWDQETSEQRSLLDRADEVGKTDSEASFRIRLEAVEAGSVAAMRSAGWHYHTGTGTPADFDRAQEYYRRAIERGSWLTTTLYAQLLAKYGHHDECERVLEDGVRVKFAPAYYWLAYFRYKRSKSRKTCREIRPYLDLAIEAGDFRAERLLARLMLFGKFGLREIATGHRLLKHLAARFPLEFSS